MGSHDFASCSVARLHLFTLSRVAAFSFPEHCGCLSSFARFAMQVAPAFHTAESKSSHLATGVTHLVVLHDDSGSSSCASVAVAFSSLLPPGPWPLPLLFFLLHGSHTIRWSTWHTTMSKSSASVNAPSSLLPAGLGTLTIRLQPLLQMRRFPGSASRGTHTAVQSLLCR